MKDTPTTRLRWLFITLVVILGTAAVSGFVFPTQNGTYHPFKQMVAPFLLLSDSFPRPFDLARVSRASPIEFMVLCIPIISLIAVSASIAYAKRVPWIIAVSVLAVWWAFLTFLYSVATSSSY